MNKIKIYIDEFGTKVYENSKGYLHRVDGPALEYSNGDKVWYKEGQWHRLDGPAVEAIDGDKVWYKEGQWHRTDGSAIEWADGSKSWYILRKKLEIKEFNSWISRIKKFI